MKDGRPDFQHARTSSWPGGFESAVHRMAKDVAGRGVAPWCDGSRGTSHGSGCTTA